MVGGGFNLSLFTGNSFIFIFQFVWKSVYFFYGTFQRMTQMLICKLISDLNLSQIFGYLVKILIV